MGHLYNGKLVKYNNIGHNDKDQLKKMSTFVFTLLLLKKSICYLQRQATEQPLNKPSFIMSIKAEDKKVTREFDFESIIATKALEVKQGIEQGNLLHLFDKAYKAILLSLKSNSFSRFKRSIDWEKFVKQQKPDFLKQIMFVTDELILDVDDFSRNHHTIRDIEIMAYVFQDYSHWKLLHGDKTFNLFISDTINLTPEYRKKHGNLMCMKMVFDLEAKPADVIDVWHSKKQLSNYGMFNFRGVDYKSADPSKGLFATSVTQINHNLGPFLKTRSFLESVSFHMNPVTGAWYQMDHSCEHLNKIEDKNCIWGIEMNCHKAEPLDNTRTRVTCVSLSNAKGNIEAPAIANSLTKFIVSYNMKNSLKYYKTALAALPSETGEYRRAKKQWEGMKENATMVTVYPNMFQILEKQKQ